MHLGLFLSGLSQVFTVYRILGMCVGVAFGMAMSTIPGLSAALAISLALPIVFSMDAATGLIILGSIWGGAIYGASKAAILINTPGNPSAMTTTFDGYPMTLRGDAAKALFGALIASASGGLISAAVLLLLFGPLSTVALQFGSAQFFWLSLLGLTTISSMTEGGLSRGLLGALLGILLSLIGMNMFTGLARFTFGIYELSKGVNLIAGILGFFSFSQMLNLMGGTNRYIADYEEKRGYLLDVFRSYIRNIKVVLRSGFIGTAVGMLPGAGSPIATLVAYGESKRWDKHPERFGTGVIEGVFTSEAAANATIGGSLIPLMSLGIPGDADAAVVAGGLLAFGLQPGPKMIQNSGLVAYTFIASLFVANLFMLVIGFFMMRITGRLLLIPKRYITPTVIALAMLGTYSLNDSMFDVGIMLACGLLAYVLRKIHIHPGTLALGLILGPIANTGFTQTLLQAQASGSIMGAFFGSPVSIILILLIGVAVGSSYALRRRTRVVVEGGFEV